MNNTKTILIISNIHTEKRMNIVTVAGFHMLVMNTFIIYNLFRVNTSILFVW